jgi:hypothetical protein
VAESDLIQWYKTLKLERKGNMEKNSTFTKVSPTEKPLYGPRKLLICGVPQTERSGILNILKLAGMDDVPTVWVESKQADNLLKDLFALPDKSGFNSESELFRAVIMGGITQKELHQLMGTYRNNGMALALWAVLTPTSENWTVKMLLEELDTERCRMREKMASKNS